MSPAELTIVTGAAGHVGTAVSTRLFGEGRRLVLLDIRDAKLRSLAEKLDPSGERVAAVVLDVTDTDAVRDAIDRLVMNDHRIVTLINVAGGPRNGLVHELSGDDFRYALELNLTGSFNTVRACVPHMKKEGGGCIVNTGSTSVFGVHWFAHTGQSNYAAANAGLYGLTRSLAHELAPWGIRINTVVPGPIETEKSRAGFARLEEDPAVKVSPLSAIPLGRLGTPEDVAGAISFLASDDASYITGTLLHVSGGLTG